MMMKVLNLLFLIVPLAVIAWIIVPIHAAHSVELNPPAHDITPTDADIRTAVFSGGCFWGMQAVFEHVKGVRQAVAGYAGGPRDQATYEDVSTGRTGHAESVKISFDPQQVSYGQLLQIFFSVAHDPTEINRQGPDTGTQYRSAIFATDREQQEVAKDYIAQLDREGAFQRPIATQVNDYTAFYPAESYHQDYAIHHPDNLYIARNDLPKVADLKQMFPALYSDQPVTVTPKS